MKYKDEDPDNLGGGMLPAKVLKMLNELLERLHQADFTNQGSKIEVVYVASGGQHVDHVENQYFYGKTHPNPPCLGREEKTLKGESFDDNTPLSALFRENHHEELRKVIESWRPYMVNDLSDMDALQLDHFEFNLTAIRPVSIYMDLVHLVNHDALRPPMSVLAAYMFQHSNLSRSEKALYVQLKRYKKLCE